MKNSSLIESAFQWKLVHFLPQKVKEAHLKHTTTLSALSVHYILQTSWSKSCILPPTNRRDLGRPIIMIGLWCYNKVDRAVDYQGSSLCRMCFNSVKTLRPLHSQLWKRYRPSATAFLITKNVDVLGLYPIYVRPLHKKNFPYKRTETLDMYGMLPTYP